MSIIQFLHKGAEYTTRHELAIKYPYVSYNRMQRLLERKDMVFVRYKNQFFFEKASTEQLIESLVPAPPLTSLTDNEREAMVIKKLASLGEGVNTSALDLFDYTPISDLDYLLN